MHYPLAEANGNEFGFEINTGSPFTAILFIAVPFKGRLTKRKRDGFSQNIRHADDLKDALRRLLSSFQHQISLYRVMIGQLLLDDQIIMDIKLWTCHNVIDLVVGEIAIIGAAEARA